ncbi:histidine phosphatase family protein [Streptomyces sp. NPDC002790]|uniref:histidine phosphatase family protein n=1 Tax=Streptomyces sp. NPDC002790 TaxID=3154431 RepID=UPI00331D7747
MTTRLLLVSPAVTASARSGVFDDGASLDSAGAAQARRAAGTLPLADRVVVSPGTRCAQTADALGLNAGQAAPALAGLDAGSWRGRSLDDVSATEPQAVARWLTDPEASPPGGESVADVCARVGRWLDEVREGGTASGRVVAVVEPEVVRAAAVHATGAPLSAFWRLDVAPLSATEFSGRSGRWNIRLGRMLGAE